MRKLVANSLILLLFLSNASVVFATHFCGGSPVSSDFGFSASSISCAMDENRAACDTGDMPADTCCENSIVSLDLDSDFTLFANPLASAFALELPAQFLPKNTISASRTIAVDNSAYSPPLPKQKRYISFQVFRI